jgi:hypothetical protein
MASGRGRYQRLWAGVTAIVVAAVLAGCQVTTSVVVHVGQHGRGSVTVTVDFDRGATRAVGDIDAQLRDSDLVAAGWLVRTTTGSAGSTDVTLVHAFSRLGALHGLLAELGRSPTGRHQPLFDVQVRQTRAFFHTTTTLTGGIDLGCGVACFGDAGLQRTDGSDVGVDPSTLEGAAGASAATRALRFSFGLQVAGRISSTDAPVRRPALTWTPILGRTIPLAATTTAIDSRHVAETTAAGAVTVIVVGAVIVVVVIGVRRRRGRNRAAGGAHRRT